MFGGICLERPARRKRGRTPPPQVGRRPGENDSLGELKKQKTPRLDSRRVKNPNILRKSYKSDASDARKIIGCIK
jgi:hypothetical protein